MHFHEDLGWPCRRTRSFTVVLNTSTVAWLGPAAGSEELLADFFKYVQRRVAVDCDVFAHLDSERTAGIVRAQCGAAAGLTGVETATADLQDLLGTEKGQDRVEQALAMVSTRSGRSGCVAADISQNNKRMGRVGPWLPTATRSMILAMFRSPSDTTGYLFTPREIAFAHGWPSISAVEQCSFYEHCAGYPLWSLPLRQQQQLQGNGIHLLSMAAVCLYLFAHTVKRDTLAEFAPAPTTPLPAPGSTMTTSPAPAMQKRGTTEFNFDGAGYEVDEHAAESEESACIDSASADGIDNLEAEESEAESGGPGDADSDGIAVEAEAGEQDFEDTESQAQAQAEDSNEFDEDPAVAAAEAEADKADKE